MCEKPTLCKDVADHATPIFTQLALFLAALGWFTALVLHYTMPASPTVASWEPDAARREERYAEALRQPPVRRAGPLARRAVPAHLL